MFILQASAILGRFLEETEIQQTLHAGLGNRFTRQKVLVIIPDHTRSLPLPTLFQSLVRLLHDTQQLDFMVALGTHPPLSPEKLCALVGITPAEREEKFRHVGLFNHTWDQPDSLQQIGTLTRAQIQAIAGADWHETLGGDVPVRINRRIFSYDHILILGPTFPHEVAGFSGGAKYLFPGISGPEMIHTSHWLGALLGVRRTIGIKNTPVRRMIQAAAALVSVPVTLIGLVVDGAGLAGLFIGDREPAWSGSADLSRERHIIWSDKPYRQVLSWAPPMYDELWTGGKAMYKLDPVVADGGELIIYAPHLTKVSDVHGKYIEEIGYHVLPYFLAQWDRFKTVPLGVLAHSTHVRGDGSYQDGIESARIQVSLASQISEDVCRRLNLGYRDPASIEPAAWQDREAEGILYVPQAGERLYRVKPAII